MQTSTKYFVVSLATSSPSWVLGFKVSRSLRSRRAALGLKFYQSICPTRKEFGLLSLQLGLFVLANHFKNKGLSHLQQEEQDKEDLRFEELVFMALSD